jgi:hypothetical protein
VQRTAHRRRVAALAALVVLALPFFSMRLAFTDAGNDPATSTTTRQAFDALATGFGPGFNGPLIIAATVPAGQTGHGGVAEGQGGGHPGSGLRRPAAVQRVGTGRGDHRLPDHRRPSRPRPRRWCTPCGTT